MSALLEHIKLANNYQAAHHVPLTVRWVSEKTLDAIIDDCAGSMLYTVEGNPIGKNNKLAIEETKRRAREGKYITQVYGCSLKLIEVLPPRKGHK